MTTNNALLSQETYISNDTEHVADIFNFLEAHEAAGRATIQPGYFLTGTGVGDQVEIPRGTSPGCRRDATRSCSDRVAALTHAHHPAGG
jgi:hypothetical protein